MSIKLQKLLEEWKTANLDLRQTHDGRWFDQKVTPDIVAVCCKVIASFLFGSNRAKFTSRDLRTANEFVDTMEREFGKPSPKHPQARSEYDKVIQQPLNVLRSARIIILESPPNKRTRVYSVNPKYRDLISLMADSEQETAEFLDIYIQEVLGQSDLVSLFQNFLENQEEKKPAQLKISYSKLKDGYAQFIIDNTKIKTVVECGRIFSKVLNIQAYFKRSRGSSRGSLSEAPISLSNIRYNQINFLDARKKKPKHVPRRQSNKTVESKSTGETSSSSSIRRTINDVKAFHVHKSEIQDKFSSMDLSKSCQVQGHHIFSRSDYSELANFRENIILLTPTQHLAQAHNSNQVYSVQPAYQYLCLQKKISTIEKCDNDPNCSFYSFSELKKMLYMVRILDNNYKNNSFDDVRRILVEFYTMDPA